MNLDMKEDLITRWETDKNCAQTCTFLIMLKHGTNLLAIKINMGSVVQCTWSDRIRRQRVE